MGKRRAEDQEAEQQAEASAQAAPQPPPRTGMDPEVIAQLKDLGQLHEDGVLTDREFEQQKSKLLAV